MQTAGRTVVFSAITVMISLLAFLIFPFPYLRSFAYAGVAVVGARRRRGGGGAPRGARGARAPDREGPPVQAQGPADDGGGFWQHQAERVMRHPWPYLHRRQRGAARCWRSRSCASSSVRSTTGSCRPTWRAAGPRSTRSARTSRAARTPPSACHLPGVDPTTDIAAIDAFAKELRALPGVARVDAATGFYFKDGTDVPRDPVVARSPRGSSATPRRTTRGSTSSPTSSRSRKQGEQLVADVRDTLGLAAVHGVAGPSARLVDAKRTIERPPSARARLHRAR